MAKVDRIDLDGQVLELGGSGASVNEWVGTLSAGETTLIYSDEKITEEATVDIYTSSYGVNPTNVSVSAGAISIAFNEMESDLQVKVRWW